ncbi:MAG: CDP-alcohol phosphatidyltransferase family protein [Patescibacteria group bacterium]
MFEAADKLHPQDKLLKPLVSLIPKGILPNHLTVFRMLGTPLVWYFLTIDEYFWGLIWFLILAFTDALDGAMARLRSQITVWGKFYDPVADKLLVVSTVIMIMVKRINIFISIAIIFLELVTIMGGIIRKKRNIVVPANKWGKIKMLLQTVGVGLVLLGLYLDVPILFLYSTPAFGLAIIFAILSLLAEGFKS